MRERTQDRGKSMCGGREPAGTSSTQVLRPVAQLRPTLRPQGPQPVGLLCPRDCLGKNTGVGCYALLQGNLPDPGIEPS